MPGKVLDDSTYPFPNSNGCTIEMDELSDPTLYNGCNYLSMFVIKIAACFIATFPAMKLMGVRYILESPCPFVCPPVRLALRPSVIRPVSAQ